MGRKSRARSTPPQALPNPPPRRRAAETIPLSFSRNRLWALRFLFVVGSPMLFLLLLELILRVIGFGYPTNFFLPGKIHGRPVAVQNDRSTWRFLGRELARRPFPAALPRPKQPGTIRIFVLGESAAYGDPQPEFGLARMLEALLEGRYPGTRFEVVNAAVTAINSNVILPIGRDCARQDGDLWVIYMGNNEVVGPFGAGTVFGAPAANPVLIRASLAAKTLRSGQLLDQLLSRLKAPPASESEWGGMRMFLQHQVRQDDSRMKTVYSHFEHNLRELLALGRRNGVRVVISTVVSNLKDCAPFSSLHRPGLEQTELEEWTRLYQNGMKAQQAGHPAEAVDFFAQASRLDDSFADLQFAWGQCCMALGQDAQARGHLVRARDEDALRFRADTRINEIIRDCSSGRAAEGIGLVDLEQAQERTSVGNELLYEHVHLRFEGNYRVARAFAEGAERLVPALQARGSQSLPDWPSETDCAQRLGWTDWNRYQAESGMLSRMTEPPFTGQANHRQQYEQALARLERLRSAPEPARLRSAEQVYRMALSRFPADWILNQELALVLERLGEFDHASDCWREVVNSMPHHTEAWQSLGRSLAQQKRDSEARAAFEQSLLLDPDMPTALTGQAEIFSRSGRPQEAMAYYERILKRKPYWGPAHWGLGTALEALGRPAEAQPHFRQALQDRMYTPAALKGLAQLCFAKGWLNEACTNFMDALKLEPFDAATEVNLGVTLALLHRNQDAQSHYAAALRLDPNLAEAHARLGLELGRQGDDAAALEHFAQAVRLKPDLLEARLNLGIALLKQGRQADAIAEFNEVLRRDPNNQVALQSLQKLKKE
jgi:tetratricopeptide (TPR) repeat protein